MPGHAQDMEGVDLSDDDQDVPSLDGFMSPHMTWKSSPEPELMPTVRYIPVGLTA